MILCMSRGLNSWEPTFNESCMSSFSKPTRDSRAQGSRQNPKILERMSNPGTLNPHFERLDYEPLYSMRTSCMKVESRIYGQSIYL